MRIARDADSILGLLAQNGGNFPITQPLQPPDAEDFEVFQPGPGNPIGVETPFQTRYFSVTFAAEGQVKTVNTDQIAAVQNEEAVLYAQRALNSGKTSGYDGAYRYLAAAYQGDTLVIFLDCGRDLENLWTFVVINLTVSAACVACVLVLVLILSRALLKPVAESYQKQKRFITDAGHELKTPLTIIAASAEVLELENGANEWTASIRKQVERLSAMTQELVSLARMDETGESLTMTDFSISDAVCESAEQFDAPVVQAGKTLTVDVRKHISYHGNEDSIRRLVNILVENAVKYTDRNGSITVRLWTRGRRCILTVSNTTDGMQVGDQGVLFERFYRADTSRNSGTGGSGIGLSVAQAIVQAHKGTITAVCNDGITLTITAVL